MDTSYLTSQVASIVSSLHGLFDEIGVNPEDRESREAALYAALHDTLHSQLRLVAAEKNSLAEEANKLICAIKQMGRSLDDNARESGDTNRNDEEDLQVTYPLLQCVERLKERHAMISKVHAQRFEQVKKLVHALTTYSSQMEAGFVRINLPSLTAPSPTFKLSLSYIQSLDEEFSRVYEEFTRRMASVKAICTDIVQLWAELGTPSAQTEQSIVECCRSSAEHTGVREEDILRLKSKKERLINEKKAREKKVDDLKHDVRSLWERLGIDDAETTAFVSRHRGCGLRTIQGWQEEFERLVELKKQNLHLFVEDARQTIQGLWDSLYFSEDEMLGFHPAFSDVYTDALLEAHEMEIGRLQTMLENRGPLLAMIEKHQSLLNDRTSLEASSQDSSRLMNRGGNGGARDPTRLLREEKMRKRIAKELPKIERDLIELLESWEQENGRPFTVHGDGYLDFVVENQKPSGGSTRGVSRTPAPKATSARPTPVPRGQPANKALANATKPTARPPAAAPSQASRMQTKSPTPFNRAPLSSVSHTNDRKPPYNDAGRKTPSTNRRIDTVNPRSGAGRKTPTATTPTATAPKTLPAYMLQGAMAPPKMRALEPAPPHHRSTVKENQRFDISVDEEDRYMMKTTYGPNEDRFAAPRQLYGQPKPQSLAQEPHYPPNDGGRRVMSSTSTSSHVTGTSSENWETYGEDSADDTELNAYYDNLRAARGKRNMEQSYNKPPVKRPKGIKPGNFRDAFGGDDDGWSDEDIF